MKITHKSKLKYLIIRELYCFSCFLNCFSIIFAIFPKFFRLTLYNELSISNDISNSYLIISTK